MLLISICLDITQINVCQIKLIFHLFDAVDLYNNYCFKIFSIRNLFFQPRMNLLIFLPILRLCGYLCCAYLRYDYSQDQFVAIQRWQRWIDVFMIAIRSIEFCHKYTSIWHIEHNTPLNTIPLHSPASVWLVENNKTMVLVQGVNKSD